MNCRHWDKHQGTMLVIMNTLLVVATLASSGRAEEIAGDDGKLNKSSVPPNRLVATFDLNQTNTHFRPKNLVTFESLAGSTVSFCFGFDNSLNTNNPLLNRLKVFKQLALCSIFDHPDLDTLLRFTMNCWT